MEWDYQDQLKATVKTDETTYYVYSGGERVRKVCMNTATEKIKHERIYLGGHELYRKYDANGELEVERQTDKVMDDKRMVALLEVKTVSGGSAVSNFQKVTRYQLTNHLDSASVELDENAQILSYEEYHPFGTTSYSMHTNDSEVSLKRYRYVHKERDGETGLYYYGARYYAPWLSRFVSVDPLKDKYPFYSSYQYTGNNPVTFTDLDGRETTENTRTNVEPNGQQSEFLVKDASGNDQLSVSEGKNGYDIEGVEITASPKPPLSAISVSESGSLTGEDGGFGK